MAKKAKKTTPAAKSKATKPEPSKVEPEPKPVNGFLLAADDPFAIGALRSIGQPGLPFVLPFEAKSAAVLKNYIIRANGAGDKTRADAAKDALEKCE